MKKLMTMIVAATVAGVATADLTAWNVSGGVATDEAGTSFAAFASTAITLSGDQVALFTPGGTIDLTLLQSLTVAGDVSAVGVGPAFLGGKYGTAFTSDGSAAGLATFLIVNRAITSFGDIVEGDYVGVASLTATFTIDELWATYPAGTPNPTQGIVLGNVQTSVEVIPEPATLGLMGIAGLGMFLARKKTRA